MGMAASQARFLNLTSRKSDLEYQVQQVNQQRTLIADQTLPIYNSIVSLAVPSTSNFDMTTTAGQTAYSAAMNSYTAQMNSYNAQEAYFQQQDKILEMQLKNLDTQHQAVQTEIDSVKKVIEKNVDGTFKTFA